MEKHMSDMLNMKKVWRGSVIDGRTWTVDLDGDVQWTLSHQPSRLVSEDFLIAAEVMGCHARITDPEVPEGEAMDMLREARAVTKAVIDQMDADLRARVELAHAVEVGGEVYGPYSIREAMDRANELSGHVIRLRK